MKYLVAVLLMVSYPLGFIIGAFRIGFMAGMEHLENIIDGETK